jgi:hypothetical protein
MDHLTVDVQAVHYGSKIDPKLRSGLDYTSSVTIKSVTESNILFFSSCVYNELRANATMNACRQKIRKKISLLISQTRIKTKIILRTRIRIGIIIIFQEQNKNTRLTIRICERNLLLRLISIRGVYKKQR